MTPVLYMLECSLTSFQQWDFQWYHFNNVYSFNRDINMYYCVTLWFANSLHDMSPIATLACTECRHAGMTTSHI